MVQKGSTYSLAAIYRAEDKMDINAEQPEEVFQKLQKLADIRLKSADLGRLQLCIQQEATEMESEEVAQREYNDELEQLRTEKLSYVERLRQIHSDINLMETVVKQSMEDIRYHESKRSQHVKEYRSVKRQINDWRIELGLDKAELNDFESTLELNDADAEFSSPADDVINGEVKSSSTAGSKRTNSSRAQIPPMKRCTSCQQYIHRNAPICPLCKAKSRSANPKKARKSIG